MPIGHRSFSKCHVEKKQSWAGERVQLHGAQDAPRPWSRVSSRSHGNTGLSIFALPRTLLCVWSSAGTALRVSCHVCACPLAGAATWDRPGEVARLHCAVLPHSPILAAWRRVEPLQLGSPVNRYVAKDMPTHISTQGGFETLALEVRHHRLVGSRFPLDTVRRNHFNERPVRTLSRRMFKRSCEIHVRLMSQS